MTAQVQRAAQQSRPRRRTYRQWPHRGAGRHARPHRLVVLSAARFRPRVLAAPRRRRGEGVLRRRPARANVRRTRQYVRNTAIVETVLEDASGNAVRITDFAPRFLRFERAFHPAQIIRRIEPLRGLPRITHPPAADLQLRQAGRMPGHRLQPHALWRRRQRAARHDRCAALLYRPRDAVRADAIPSRSILGPDEPLEASVDSVGARISRANAQLLAHMGARARHPARMAIGDHPRRDHAEALCTSRRRAPSSPRTRRRSPRRPEPSAIGTTASAGCATPTSSSAR